MNLGGITKFNAFVLIKFRMEAFFITERGVIQ